MADRQPRLHLDEADPTVVLDTGVRAPVLNQRHGALVLLPDLDDFSACRIERKEDLRDLFVTPFYFGCEADDRMNAWAFDRRVNPFGARLNALFGSDIGHFDVPDMLDVLPEAWELREDGLITADDFRDFTFANAVRLWGAGNPRFFEGTAVAKAAAEVLGTR